MTKLNQIYRCNICGNIVEMIHEGAGQLVCCGQAMELLLEKTEDQGAEKHLPVAKKIDGGVRIKIGSVAHPMEKEHYIEWIEIITEDGKVGRKFLRPDDKPEADFFTPSSPKTFRAYCNLHGLWKA
ncbi:MAG: desulfoferrodoxin [Candidatus Paceibacterota bacterium]|jgi:superoxide reductase